MFRPGRLLLLALALGGGWPLLAEEPAPAAPPASGMTRDEKYRAPLTKIPNELGKELPYSMRLDNAEFAALFPLAFSTDNAWWYTEGPDRFLVFKYPKSEPFEDRTGKFIKPPGSGQWAYLVAEDDFNFYFQWMPPGEMLSAEWKGNQKTKALAGQRSEDLKIKTSDVDPAGGDASVEQAKSYLGAPGHDVPQQIVERPEIDALEFREASVGLPRSGLWQMRTAVADLNGDGQLDIVSTPARKQTGGRPVIWLGDGGKRWKVWEEAKFPTEVPFDYGSVEVADFDRDGHLDIAMAMHFKGSYVFFGDGKGDFTQFFKFFDGSTFTARSLAVGDFDRDGHPDVALFAEINLDPKTNAVVIGRMIRPFLYRSRTEFEPRDDGATPHLIGDDIAVGDFDRDKFPDLVSSSHVWGHTGLVHMNRKGKGWKISREKLLGNCYYWGVTAGDVDGDGYDDLVLGFSVIENKVNREQGGIAIFYNKKGSGFADPTYLVLHDKPGFADPTYLVLHDKPIPYFVVRLGDLDRDGRTDIVASGAPDGGFHLYLQRKKGEFLHEKMPEMPLLTSHGVRIADIDKDGWQDLIVNYSSEEMGGAIKCWLGGKRPQ